MDKWETFRIDFSNHENRHSVKQKTEFLKYLKAIQFYQSTNNCSPESDPQPDEI